MQQPWLSACIGLSVLAAVAWHAYFRWKDRKHPEPLWLTVAAVGGGMVSVVLALIGYQGFAAAGIDVQWEHLADPSWNRVVFFAATIGAIEELPKLAVVLPIALWSRHFDEPLDGVVYGACAGIGFAVSESIVMFQIVESPIHEAVVRAMASPLSHALFATPAGLGLGLFLLTPQKWALPVGIAFSIGAHALYDVFLARPEATTLLAAICVLMLWLSLILMTPKLVQIGRIPRRPR